MRAWGSYNPFSDKANNSYSFVRCRSGFIIQTDNASGLQGITCPSLVLSANDDLLTPVALGDELVNGIKDCRRYIFGKGGHFYPVVMAETFNNVLNDFLNTLNSLCPMQQLNH